VRAEPVRKLRTPAAVILLLAAVAPDAAVLDVHQLPGRDRLLAAARVEAALVPAAEALGRGDTAQAVRLAAAQVSTAPQDEHAQLLMALAWYADGADTAILKHLAELDRQFPELGAALHETLAGVYLQERRLYRASEHLDAIPASRRSDQARFMAANIAARQGRLEDAARLFDALSAGTGTPSAVVEGSRAGLALTRHDYETAASAAQRLLQVNRNDAAASIVLATARLQQDRKTEARRLFEGIVADNANASVAWLNLGLLDLVDGRLDDARAAFVRARMPATRDPRAYYAEAATALLAGDRAGAAAPAAGAVRLAPEDPLAALVAIAVQGKWSPTGSATVAARLVPDLERSPWPAVVATELSSTESAGRLACANVIGELWSRKAALDWLAAGRGSGNGTAPLLELTRARALGGAGDLAAARKALDALSAAPAGRGLAAPRVSEAEVAARLGDRDGAYRAIEDAVRVAPDLPRLHVRAGDLYVAAGDPARAVRAYREALPAYPRDPRLHNQLAATLALLGPAEAYEEGLRLAEAALRLQPHYLLRAQLLDTRADLLFRLGRRSEALEAYRALSKTVGGMTTPGQWHRLATLEVAAGDTAGARRAFEEALDYGRPYPGRELAMRVLDAPAEAAAGAK
jgi:tetratricopeptide (TPR) repeat protein